MAVGDNAQAAVRSYLAVGKEATYGTYTQPATALEFISCGFKTDIDVEKIDAMSGNRGMNKRVQKDKKVMGSVEQYAHPVESVLLFANAMGGGIVSALHTLTVYNHSLPSGNFATDTASLCFNHRKGDTHTFRYTGGRVNSLKMSANVGEIVKISADMIFKDSTQLSDDISASLSISSLLPFVYTGGKFRYSTTEALAATTTAEEPIQGFELTLNNGLVSDKSARQLGSALLSVLPPTRRAIEFKISQRFDTTTAYNRFIQATQGAVELYLQGEQIGSTGFYNEMTIRLPKVFYDSADVEVKDSGSILQADIPMSVLVDNPNTTTGKDIGVSFRNGVAAP